MKLLRCLALVLVVGSLSASGTACSNATCYQSSGSPQTLTAHEDEAINEGRCFAVCVDAILGNCEDCNDSLSLLQLGVQATRDLAWNCSIYQQLKNCQRGCTIVTNDSPEILELCQIQCSRFCEERCGNRTECDATYSNSDCKIKCDEVDQSCKKGCEVVLTMESIEGSVPASPINSPSLNLLADSDKGGQYILNLDTSQTTASPSQNNEIFSFIIRIESDHSTSYIWQAKANSSRLDLEDAACLTVNVSYAAVNKNGISADYSPSSQICVNGETRYPEQLQSISFTYEEDLQFSRHALTNISWSRPRGYEYVESYLLGILSTSEECGGLYTYKTYSVPKISTSYVVSSDTEADLPFYNCTYTVLLRVLPQKQGAYPVVTHMIPTWTSPDMSVNCSRELLVNGTLTAKVMWTLPTIPGLLEAVKHFEITSFLVDNSSQPASTQEEYSHNVVTTQINNRDYTAVIHNLKPTNKSYLQYEIKVKSIQNRSFSWRRVPKTVTCHIESVIESPSPVSASLISIENLVLTKDQQNLMMQYSWNVPQTPNGVIDRYEMRITKGSTPTGTASHDLQTIYSKSIKEISSTRDAISLPVTTAACLFLQIRSRNQFLWSNWSEPVALSPDSNQCSTEVAESTSVANLNSIMSRSSSEMSLTITPQPSQTPKVVRLSETIIFLVTPAVVVCIIIAVLVVAILILLKRRAIKENQWKATMYEERENY